MPLLYSQHYPVELLEFNPHISCIYVESQKKIGGGRPVVYVRKLVRGMPVTLRENYSTGGYLKIDTKIRDHDLIDKEFKNVLDKLRSMCIVCLPVIPFQTELIQLEKRSPKIAKLLSDRMHYMRETYG